MAPLIAEVKRASPSAGDIKPDADVLKAARAMLKGGAIALSVLTEPKYFRGDPSFLREIRNVVGVPILRKDFIVDEYQLHESAELGADAVSCPDSCVWQKSWEWNVWWKLRAWMR